MKAIFIKKYILGVYAIIHEHCRQADNADFRVMNRIDSSLLQQVLPRTKRVQEGFFNGRKAWVRICEAHKKPGH